jgi:hypothetical protein
MATNALQASGPVFLLPDLFFAPWLGSVDLPADVFAPDEPERP